MVDQGLEYQLKDIREDIMSSVLDITLPIRGYNLMGCAKILEEDPSFVNETREWIGEKLEDIAQFSLSLYFIPSIFLAKGYDRI